MINLKTNVVKKNYAFRVRYPDGKERVIAVMAESETAARLQVQSDEYEVLPKDYVSPKALKFRDE